MGDRFGWRCWATSRSGSTCSKSSPPTRASRCSTIPSLRGAGPRSVSALQPEAQQRRTGSAIPRGEVAGHVTVVLVQIARTCRIEDGCLIDGEDHLHRQMGRRPSRTGGHDDGWHCWGPLRPTTIPPFLSLLVSAPILLELVFQAGHTPIHSHAERRRLTDWRLGRPVPRLQVARHVVTYVSCPGLAKLDG